MTQHYTHTHTQLKVCEVMLCFTMCNASRDYSTLRYFAQKYVLVLTH